MAKRTTSWSHQDPYNPEVGLWKQARPGHTKPIAHLDYAHSGPDAASRLLIAADRAKLGEFPTTEVIKALSDLQVRDNSKWHGCCRWYAEESEPVDTNASFFIALNLIVLNAAYREDLSAEQAELIDIMLEAFIPWFTFEAEEGKVHYPNKYLGDLVSLWLLREQAGKSTADLEPILEKSAHYWQETHWGWGEHLSDPYSSILLDELSSLLCLARTLPESIRELYTCLFKELIHIEDAYDGGPRVPTIRCYALNGQMQHDNYRTKIRPIDQVIPPDHNTHQVPHLFRFPFGHVLHERGWHELAGPQAEPSPIGSIECYGNAQARYTRSGNFRLGALSHFPIMENTDQPTWGMSWQSLPVALSSEAGDWGFLRWGTKEADIERFYPAKDKHSAYLKNSLSDTVTPVISGQTFSTTNGSSFLVLRRMPQISKAWEWCSDTFTLHDFSGRIESCEELESGWHQLALRWPDGHFLTIHFHPLESASKPELDEAPNLLTWGITWAPEEIRTCNQLNGLWCFHLGDQPEDPPELTKNTKWYLYPHFTPGDASWDIEWCGKQLSINSEGLI